MRDPLRGRSADRRARAAGRLRPRRRGLAPGGDRHRRLAPGRDPAAGRSCWSRSTAIAGSGSGRSIEAFDLLGGLTACAEHSSLRRPPRRRRARDRACAHRVTSRPRFAPTPSSVLDAEGAVAVERVDAVVDGDQLGMSLAEELREPRALRAREPHRLADARGGAVRRCAPDGRRQARPLHRRVAAERARAPSPSGQAGGCPSTRARPPRRRSRSR